MLETSEIAGWLILSILSGTVIGLTGSGGAIVGVPLIVHLLGFQFREATVIAQWLVVVAALFNSALQKQHAKIKLAALIGVFSIIGSYFGSWIKPTVPDLALKLIFLFIGAFALVNLFFKPKRAQGPHPQDTLDSEHLLKNQGVLFLAMIGSTLGVLTSLTGLGGGVLLVPFMVRFFGFSFAVATASSLISVFLISSISLSFQWSVLTHLIPIQTLFITGIGITVSALAVRSLILKVPAHTMTKVRQVILVILILLATTTIW